MSFLTLREDLRFVEFEDYVRERLGEYEATLRGEAEPWRLYRAQGAVEALTWVLGLPEAVTAWRNWETLTAPREAD